MLFALLLGFIWQLSHLYICSAQCTYTKSTACGWENSPDTAFPNVATYSGNLKTTYCDPKNSNLWKDGITDGKSIESSPLVHADFFICQNSFSLKGYVPLQTDLSSSTCGEVKDSSSGITIGYGVDLGRVTATFLATAGISDSVISSWDAKGYFDVTGSAAAEKACSDPLTVDLGQALSYSNKVMLRYASIVQEWYDRERPALDDDGEVTVPFDELPLGIRTVLTSIQWRLGRDESHNFWKLVLKNDFVNAADELGKYYTTTCTSDERLQSEANILKASLGCTTSSGGVDVVFLLDESGSVGSANYDKAKQWVINFVEAFDSSISINADSGVRFGLSTFAVVTDDKFTLNDYSSIIDYRIAIQNILYISGGGTALGDALTHIKSSQFASNIVRDISISRVVIVLTDGASNSGQPVSVGAADIKQEKKVSIIAVAIGDYIDETQINDISNTKYYIDDYVDLNGILDGITTQTCYSPLQLDESAVLKSVEFKVGESKTFDVDIQSVASVDSVEYVVLEITQHYGCGYVYIAYCLDTQYPSYYHHDVRFASCSQQYKQIIMRPKTACGETIKVTIEARDIQCNNRRRLQAVTYSFDLDISTCNSAAVGCVNGTNYDPDLNVDPPYDISEVVVVDPTIQQTQQPTPSTTPSSIMDTIPTTYVYVGAAIVVVIIILCCICCIRCNNCGAKKSQKKEKQMYSVVYVE